MKFGTLRELENYLRTCNSYATDAIVSATAIDLQGRIFSVTDFNEYAKRAHNPRLPLTSLAADKY
jgi:hypothetical protein